MLSIRTLPLLAFMLLVATLGFALLNDPRKMPSQLIDKPVPEFKLAGLEPGDGGLASADLKGSVKLLNVFASWCPGCRVEHPTLLRLQREGKIELHGINWKDKPGEGLRWLRAHRSPYFKVGDDSNGRLGIDLGVTGVPETFVIDSSGRIRYRHAGPLTEDVWSSMFEPLLKGLGGR